MEYKPELSIKENAQLNGVTESAVRKYLMVNKIDRRFDEKLKRFNAVKALQRAHPDWSARAISRETGISPSTVCNYMELDELMKSEGKVSMNEELDCLRFDNNTPIDFMNYEHYNGSSMGIVAFSKGFFKYNGHSIAFSNMQSYPITFMGEKFDSTETAYIACNYGLNNTDCIRIQKEIQASTNSLLCKRQYRNNEVDKKYGRKDFFESEWHFNLMLYLVWEKCKQHPEFCEMLTAIPDNYVIIENQNPYKKVKTGNWGCKNGAALKAYNAKVKQLKASGMKGELKIKEAATIATWNVGVWEGCNHQGKILMACRTALRTGTVPCIRYDLLNKAKIYLLGRLLHFEKLEPIPISKQLAKGQFVDKHITAIPNELKWVANQDVSRLRSFLLDNPEMPYITCGMGGAFSACVYSSLLYGTYKGLGRAVTCYNLNSISDETLLKCKVLINTAAGRNDDVVQVAERLLKLKHPNAANFTPFDNENNKVKKIISKLNPESSINLDGDNMVMGKGAFVNINEAISSFSLYYKAFTGKTDFLNLDFNKTYTYTSNAGKTKVPPLGQIKHFVVLYGSYGEPVAYDFESKIVESGFASVQLADYRNFTHGRFSFVGKNICTAKTVKKCGETAVVMLVTPREKKTVEYYRQIAENNKYKTSNQVLPDWTPIITLETEYDSPLASIDLLYQLTRLYLDISHSRGTEDVEKPVCSNIDKRTPRGKIRFKQDFKKFGALHSEITESKDKKTDTPSVLPHKKNKLLGAIIGDITGSIYEQGKYNVYSYDEAILFPKGSRNTYFTDDTVLTIAVARYLLEHQEISIEGLTKTVQQYTIEHPLPIYGRGGIPCGFMYGKAFQEWIKNPKPYGGESNGCAIRCSSVGWLCDSVEQVLDVAKLTADISHNSEAGEKGTQAIALCVFLARTGKSKDEIKKTVRKLIGYKLSKNCDTLRKEMKSFVSNNKKHISALCIDSVPHAITAFLESSNYEDAIRLAISIGGDSDSIACMCGAIAGAYYDEIPEWLIKKATRKLAKYDDFMEVLKMMDEAEPRRYTIKVNNNVAMCKR